jgi:hypothetical protein
MRMSSGDPQGKMCLHILRPGFVLGACAGADDTMCVNGSTGVTDSAGSPARGANRLLCPARKFQDSEVIYCSSSLGCSNTEPLSDNIAVKATLGLTFLVLPCS